MDNNDTRPPISDEEFEKALEDGRERLIDVYLRNKLSPEQIDKTIDKGIELDALYEYQKLTPDNIDKAIDKGSDLDYLYSFQTLTPDQIDKALDKRKYLKHLYENQTLTPEQIDKAIDKGIALDDLYTRQKLNPEQINKAIDKGIALDALYLFKKLTPENIDKAIDKEIGLYSVYQNKLSSDQIDKAIDKGISLDALYEYQKLTPDQIDKAINKGISLYALYRYQKLTHEQIDKALDKEIALDALYRHHTLTPKNIDKAIEKEIALDTLYRHQTLTPDNIDKAIEKEIALDALYRHQTLTPDNIDKAIEKEIALDVLYRYQTLTPEQIYKALDKGEYISVLFTYQKNLEPRHIDYAIDHNIALDYLYTLRQLTYEQRKRILVNMYNILPEYLDSPLWRYVSPNLLSDAIRFFSESVDSRLDVHPIDDLVGVYPVHNPMNDLENAIYSKGYYLKEGDFDYVYYTDKDGRERQIRIGRALKDNPDLIDLYRDIKPVLTKIYEESHSLKILDEPLEIVISNDPVDIARKSTGQSWSSCEAIGDRWGWPTKDGCGWCDDIKANNLIAYIRKVGSDQWIGRKMIRWCMRSDDKKPDVVAEPYYGDLRYMPIMDYELMNIIRSKGYSGSRGTVSCATPYEYGGYVDEVHKGRASYSDNHIVYMVDERGRRSEEEDGGRIYRPKMLKGDENEQ